MGGELAHSWVTMQIADERAEAAATGLCYLDSYDTSSIIVRET